MARPILLALLLPLLLVPVPAMAEEEAPDPALTRALEAWAWLKTVDEWRMAVLKQSRILREGAANDAQKERAQVFGLDSLRLGSRLRDEAEAQFREAFEATDIRAWVLEEHGAIVKAGIDLAARHAFEEDPQRAIDWWDLLTVAFPDSIEAKRVKTTWLPLALPSTGDLALALTRLETLQTEVDETRVPELITARGDVHALAGDYEAARARYEEADALIPEDATRNDPRGRLKGHLDLRRALIGKPAPEIADAVWFGGEARPLSALQGRVVLLDFQATWCGPCLKSLPHLQAMEDELSPRGLSVLALTREYQKKGVLPARPGLERVLYRGTTRAEYLDHLEAFRERVGMTVPLLLIEKEVSKDYPVRGLPTMLVLDRDGTVGFVAIGGMRHHVLRHAILRRLGEAAE